MPRVISAFNNLHQFVVATTRTRSATAHPRGNALSNYLRCNRATSFAYNPFALLCISTIFRNEKLAGT